MITIPANKRAPFLAGVAVAVAVPAAFAALALNGGANRHGGDAPARVVSVGSVAPDFTLSTADGRAMHLADYKGRAVFLAFVPDLGADTHTEVRALAKSEPDFDMAGAKVIVVAPANAADARRLQTADKLPFPLLVDAGGALARRFGVGIGMRRTYVVSPQGRIKYRVDNAVIDVARHGQQLLDVSKCCVDEVAASRASGVGKPVGDYSLVNTSDPNRAMTTIFGDGMQKATAVLFLSARCPCSNTYNDRVAALAKRYAGNSAVRIVAVYANKDETVNEIAAHAKAHGFTFPVLKDDRALCAAHFNASVTPEAFVVDGAKTLRYAGRLDDSRDIADVKHHDLEDAIAAVISGKTPPAATRAFGCGIVK